MASRLWKWTKGVFAVGTLGSVLGGGVLAGYVKRMEAGLPSIHDLHKNYRPMQTTRIFGRDGTILSELFTERRTVIPTRDLPPHVKLAVLAAEDASFYEHEGLNYWGIARAFLRNVRSARLRQGGSTITQQVVKNVVLGDERSLRRKVREALLARRLEQELSKDEILDLYLNQIYFGHGRYGIEEAARDVFAKSAKELDVAEATQLAGVIACPESCSPLRHPERARERRQFVIGQLQSKAMLGADSGVYQRARDALLHVATSSEVDSAAAPEVVALVRRELARLSPDLAERGGLSVYTTIDAKLQNAARIAVRDNLHAYDKRHGLNGLRVPKAPKVAKPAAPPKKGARVQVAKGPTLPATPKLYKTYDARVTRVDATHVYVSMPTADNAIGVLRADDFARYNLKNQAPETWAPVGAGIRVSVLAERDAKGLFAVRPELGPQSAFVALDARTREVVALVGSFEGTLGSLDRATQARRQPGSTFKPVVYSYALHSRQFTAASMIDVTPRTFGDYTPSNYEGWTAADPMRLREVLAHSVNIGAVAVLSAVGPENVVPWARALGVRSPLQPDLSLALGSYEVSPMEMAGIYGTFAGAGVYAPPHIIRRVLGPDGVEIALPPQEPEVQVMTPAEAYVMTDMLRSVVHHGTATRAQALGRPAVGKTGTSNASKDTWFVGYTTDYVAAVWVGYDDGLPLGRAEAGGGTALPAWVSWMKVAHDGKPVTDFQVPEGVVHALIDPATGMLVTPATMGAPLDEVFLEGTAPLVGADAGPGVEDAGAQSLVPVQGAQDSSGEQ